jgi:molybdopterin-guanine dinucleotide biosynthesis protein A
MRKILLGLDVVPDRIAGQGPLMAVASALQASDSELNLIVSCDVPEVRLAVVRRMLAQADGVDVVVPITSDGREQPLFAVYRRSALPYIEEALKLGGRRLSDIYNLCKVRFVELGDTNWFANLNTMADYERFRAESMPELRMPWQSLRIWPWAAGSARSESICSTPCIVF